MNKTVLKVFVGLIALALAVCAAFFSIVGLSKLFAGAFIAVIAMATTLEASKLVIASFLYRTWSTVNKVLRTYLIIAIAIIALITSIGIYGFLSGAYQNTKSKYELSQTASDSLSVKKTYYDNALISYKAQLDAKNSQLQSLSSIRTSQEQRALTLVNSNKSSRSADRSASQTDKTINTLNKEINTLNDSIVKFSTESSKLKLLSTQAGLQNEVSSELGSLTYISRVTGISMDTVVNILIILFMIVFDPLAICMVLAFNYLNENKEEQKQHIIDIMKSDEELGLYEDVQETKSVEDIEVIEPEVVQTEENIDIEIPDYWDNLTDEELSEIVNDMLVQERELIMEDTPTEQPQEPTVEDTNDSKPIDEELKRKAQEEENERVRIQKQKKNQRSIGGAAH
jgi:hypothetical protein